MMRQMGQMSRMGRPMNWVTLILAAALWQLPAIVAAVELSASKAAPTAEDIARAEKQIKQQFKPLQAESSPPLVAIREAALNRSFPSDLFFSATFRQFPVARLAPEPLQSQNLFIVHSDGKIDHVTDTKVLEAFFRSHVQPVKDEAAAKDAAHAWLLLSEQLKQDGFYKFELPTASLTAATGKGERKASGKVLVTAGGQGEFSAILRFNEDGKLTALDETNNIKEGVRPICQATKLLDPDPIVRRMAEKDILVMGRAAKGYLDEQRAKASPELQKAIDRMWRRIVEEGW